MNIYLVKKEKGRIYKSEDIVRALFGLELTHDEDGAPRLAVGEAPRPAAGLLRLQQAARHLSITDTKNYWACALSDSPVGIDMEEKDRLVKPDVVKRFHKEEQEYLAALSEGSREWTEEFLSVWTRKEAYSKLVGKGLRLGFSRFSVLGALKADPSTGGQTVPVVSFGYKDLVFGLAGGELSSDAGSYSHPAGSRAGAEIVPAEYDAPMEIPALDYAAGLLDSRAYASAALMEKLLARGYGREESEEAVEKLKEYGYINDEAYAEGLARRSAESGRGSRRISMELREKGIDKELAANTAAGYKEGDLSRAMAEARVLAEKSGLFNAAADSAPLRLAASADPDEDAGREQKKELFEKRRRLAGKISRKLSLLGYDASVIYSVLEDLGL